MDSGYIRGSGTRGFEEVLSRGLSTFEEVTWQCKTEAFEAQQDPGKMKEPVRSYTGFFMNSYTHAEQPNVACLIAVTTAEPEPSLICRSGIIKLGVGVRICKLPSDPIGGEFLNWQ